MSTIGTDMHYFFNGVGSTTIHTTILPQQTISENNKKKFPFQKACMDALESIGVSQMGENCKLREFYKMLDGSLVFSDYGLEDNSILDKIKSLGDGVGVPSFVKHYDIIGIMTRKLVGEWLKQKDNFKVNSTADEISENDFLRERTQRANEFTLQTFKNEFEIGLLKAGINPTGKEFQSEEEKQQYIQMLEQEKAKIIPPDVIDREMSKNFKTKASEWAEHTMDNDQRRFFLDKLDGQEMEDYLLTGRFFRHYYVGYDYYKPERWHPAETFFSKDVDAEYPQDGEYVGRITYIAPSQIMKRYGHLLTPAHIKTLNKRVGGADNNVNAPVKNWKTILDNGMFGQQQTVPFRQYYDYDLGLQIQDALDIPMGETIVGEEKIPSWLSPFQNQNYLGYSFSQNTRDDINVRTDVLQVTEAYWRSWKRMWFLNYTDKNGRGTSEIVTDDLLPEFIEEHGIKKISTKSLQDLQREVLNDDTMYEFWIPEVWQGIKINAGNSILGEDLYLNVQPLPYQIKGDSNLFDVKLPVAGIIGNAMAKRVRPFQVGYNICLNQIFNLLSKEIGMFFLFDINFLPSEYKDNGTIADSLEQLQTLAKETGFVPIDSQKQNIQGAQNMNTFMVQDVSFDKQINSRISLANYYLNKALEQIGFTPQRLGQATTYETATGIQQGVEATYDQTAGLFTEMSTARLKAMELHLAVAQYCQKEYIDKDFIFTGSDNDKTYINLTDPDFPLRRLALLPSNSPNERRILEQVRSYLMNTNTLGSDLLDISSAMASDTMVELISIGRKARLEKQKEVEAQRTHEQQLADKQIQAIAQEKQLERDFKASEGDKDRETKIETERINALGRASDKKSDMNGFQEINQAARDAIQNDFKERELNIKENLAQNKIENEKSKVDNIAESLRLQAESLQIKREAIQASKENSFRNSIDKNLKN